MSKYAKLSSYLMFLSVDQTTLTFGKIEEIVGSSLPRSAHLYPAWWSNQASDGHSQSSAWQSVGWRTGEVNLGSKKVTFFRIGRKLIRQVALDSDEPEVASRPQAADGLTIAKAKAGLSRHYGVPPESVEIIIKG